MEENATKLLTDQVDDAIPSGTSSATTSTGKVSRPCNIQPALLLQQRPGVTYDMVAKLADRPCQSQRRRRHIILIWIGTTVPDQLWIA
ncbi:hypothetical protein Tco_1108508 [Tanacetum coccineum]